MKNEVMVFSYTARKIGFATHLMLVKYEVKHGVLI